MARRGISVHIGVNVIDHDHYVDMTDLDFCEADAEAMNELAANQGFETHLLLGKQATRDNVTKAISDAADELKAGDILLVTYAGHGCFV